MNELLDKLIFIDKEIARVSEQASALKELISTEIKASGKDEFKKEWLDVLKSSLFHKMISCDQRMGVLEELRLSLVFNEMKQGCDCDCEEESCDEEAPKEESESMLGKGLDAAVSMVSKIIDQVSGEIEKEKAKQDKAKDEVKEEKKAEKKVENKEDSDPSAVGA
jgi:hypothetical protein